MLQGSEMEFGAEFPLNKVVQKLLIVGSGGEPILRIYNTSIALMRSAVVCLVVSVLLDYTD